MSEPKHLERARKWLAEIGVAAEESDHHIVTGLAASLASEFAEVEWEAKGTAGASAVGEVPKAKAPDAEAGRSPARSLLDELDALAGRATPLPHEVIRYDHGGGRVFVTQSGGGSDLVADFYDVGDREYWIAAANAVPKLVKALRVATEAATTACRVVTLCANCGRRYVRCSLCHMAAHICESPAGDGLVHDPACALAEVRSLIGEPGTERPREGEPTL